MQQIKIKEIGEIEKEIESDIISQRLNNMVTEKEAKCVNLNLKE